MRSHGRHQVLLLPASRDHLDAGLGGRRGALGPVEAVAKMEDGVSVPELRCTDQVCLENPEVDRLYVRQG